MNGEKTLCGRGHRTGIKLGVEQEHHDIGCHLRAPELEVSLKLAGQGQEIQIQLSLQQGRCRPSHQGASGRDVLISRSKHLCCSTPVHHSIKGDKIPKRRQKQFTVKKQINELSQTLVLYLHE